MIAWKVFHEVNGELFSYHHGFKRDNFTIHYQKGIVNLPVIEGSAIFVFRTKRDAESFIEREANDFVIKKVKIEKHDRQPEKIADYFYDVVSYWKAFNTPMFENLLEEIAISYPPDGTVFAKSLEILE